MTNPLRCTWEYRIESMSARCELPKGHSGPCGPVAAPTAAMDRRLTDAYRRDRVLELVDVELGRALNKFPSFNSPHEGWAVIREELDELWEHVKANTGDGALARTEATQVAAMALRYVLDLSKEGPWAR